jgi:hypothetical protein
MGDPFAMLGLPSSASADEVRAARRRLSKQLHPDALVHCSDDERRAAASQLAVINRSVDLALAALKAPVDTPPEAATKTARGAGHEPAAAAARPRANEAPFSAPDVEDGMTASFSIAALPVEAFELLLLAMSAIGDPKVVDEPYLLEGMVDDPALCLCRIELVPEAGGTIVTVDVYPIGRGKQPPPSALAVAGRLVAEVEALGPA